MSYYDVTGDMLDLLLESAWNSNKPFFVAIQFRSCYIRSHSVALPKTLRAKPSSDFSSIYQYWKTDTLSLSSVEYFWRKDKFPLDVILTNPIIPTDI
jgi:hypothetical protein